MKNKPISLLKKIPIIICGGLIFIALWCISLEWAVNTPNAVDKLVEEDIVKVESAGRYIYWDPEGYCIADDRDQPISEHYKMIYNDENDFGILRYIDDNGLIGYLEKSSGQELTEARYQIAQPMDGLVAAVSEDGTNMHLILYNGKRLNDSEYLEVCPFPEYCDFTKVQFMNGSWGIVDREGNEIVSGFDFVNEMSRDNNLCTGIKDGKAVMMNLSDATPGAYTVLGEYQDCTEISQVYANKFAIIKNSQGAYGLVYALEGMEDIPPQYVNIEVEDSYLYERMGDRCYVILAQKQDGTYDTLIID